jgi:hypothetical protein
MESFFALLQENVSDTRLWATREQLRTAIVTWIEATDTAHAQRALTRLTLIVLRPSTVPLTRPETPHRK